METSCPSSSRNNQRAPLLAQRRNGSNGYDAPVAEFQHATLEMLRYWSLLWERRNLVFWLTVVAALVAGLYARFIMGKVYRAEALITPIPPSENAENQAGGLMENPTAEGLSALFSFGSSSDNALVAQRYMAIVRSYDFTMHVVQRYHIDREVLRGTGHTIRDMTRWNLYQLIQSRLGTEYDYKSANLSLYFIDSDRNVAEAMLTDVLDQLREKLRSEEVDSASAAVAALSAQVAKTSDALLQNQLYDLMARQIQREKLAQVQADFAFKVIEPPVTPDYHVGHGAKYYSGLAAVLTFIGLCLFVVGRQWIETAQARLEAMRLAAAQEYDQDGEPAHPNRPSAL